MNKTTVRRINLLARLVGISANWGNNPDIDAIAEEIHLLHKEYGTPYKVTVCILNIIAHLKEGELYEVSVKKEPLWWYFLRRLPPRQQSSARLWFACHYHTSVAIWVRIEKLVQNWAISYEQKNQ